MSFWIQRILELLQLEENTFVLKVEKIEKNLFIIQILFIQLVSFLDFVVSTSQIWNRTGADYYFLKKDMNTFELRMGPMLALNISPFFQYVMLCRESQELRQGN